MVGTEHGLRIGAWMALAIALHTTPMLGISIAPRSYVTDYVPVALPLLWAASSQAEEAAFEDELSGTGELIPASSWTVTKDCGPPIEDDTPPGDGGTRSPSTTTTDGPGKPSATVEQPEIAPGSGVPGNLGPDGTATGVAGARKPGQRRACCACLDCARGCAICDEFERSGKAGTVPCPCACCRPWPLGVTPPDDR